MPTAVALERAVAALSRLPPLVVSWEIEALRAKLAQAQRGEQFLLQGGDCAESFEDCESDNIAKRLKILLQMSLVLLQGLKKPIIRVGRFAGQYAKPRSADTETRDGPDVALYRGDNVNRPGFSAAEREPDPDLLLRGYERASLTLEFRARADRRRLRRPASSGILGPGLSAPCGAARGVSEDRRFDRRVAGVLRIHERPARCMRRRASISIPATRVCTCSPNRRRPATSSGKRSGTTYPRTCRGSACARPTSMARISSISAASPIRSA